MRHFSATPQAMGVSIWRHRELIRQLVWREISGRYRASILGLLGSFVQPILMLALYSVVFSVVFLPRIPGGVSDQVPYVLALFAGMLVHGVVADTLNAAPRLVLEQPSLVTKSVFPVEILSIASMAAAIFQALAGYLVLFLGIAVMQQELHLTATLLPLVLLPVALLALGVSWVASSTGVFVRDVGQFTGAVSSILFFSSPILYPPQAVPEAWRFVLYLNPITPAVIQSRRVLLSGDVPEWGALGAYYLFCTMIMLLGYACFQRLRPGFSDVL
jgi:lipopolysaccharide transport system permease protein